MWYCCPVSRLEILVEELKALPPHMLVKAERAIRELHVMEREPGHAGLFATSGALSKEEADEWEKIINEDCRQIDEHSW